MALSGVMAATLLEIEVGKKSAPLEPSGSRTASVSEDCALDKVLKQRQISTTKIELVVAFMGILSTEV